MIKLDLSEIAMAINAGPIDSPYKPQSGKLDDVWHEGFSLALDLTAEAIAHRLEYSPGFNREAFLRDCGHSGFPPLHSPDACPSNHRNPGNDICQDCGKFLG